MSEYQNETASFRALGERNWIAEAADVCKRAAHGDLEARILNIDDQPHTHDRPLRARNQRIDRKASKQQRRADLQYLCGATASRLMPDKRDAGQRPGCKAG